MGLEKVSPLGRCPLIKELVLKMHWLYIARAVKFLMNICCKKDFNEISKQ